MAVTEPAESVPRAPVESDPLERYSTYFILWGFFLAGAVFLYWKALEAPFLFDDIYLIFKLGNKTKVVPLTTMDLAGADV